MSHLEGGFLRQSDLDKSSRATLSFASGPTSSADCQLTNASSEPPHQHEGLGLCGCCRPAGAACLGTADDAIPVQPGTALALAFPLSHPWANTSPPQLVVERLDPLVNPGVVGTPHLHQIVGGNSFNASMTPVDFDPAAESTCTSCTFAEDFSNYWTASMYFRAPNGTYRRVPQYVNLGLGGRGGMTVYYIPPYDGKTKVTAFAPVSTTGQSRRALPLLTAGERDSA